MVTEVYPRHLYAGCPCYRCDSPTWTRISGLAIARRMSLCPTCGSKRCPGARDHDQHQDHTTR
jgi:hypothetical protein